MESVSVNFLCSNYSTTDSNNVFRPVFFMCLTCMFVSFLVVVIVLLFLIQCENTYLKLHFMYILHSNQILLSLCTYCIATKFCYHYPFLKNHSIFVTILTQKF